MIFYFSGTGNSQRVAEELAIKTGQRLRNMELPIAPDLDDDEPLGLVFPVYAWGLPQFVQTFLKQIEVGNRYVWTVMTCGDDMGYTDRCLEKALDCRLNAAFSVQMPNTYVCLPGFDVDKHDVATGKVKQTMEQLPAIAQCIKDRRDTTQLTRGAMPWIKTYVLRHVFDKWLVTDKYFKTNDRCTRCGKCTKMCPTHNIALRNGHIEWMHQQCTGCLRCYHLCPMRAVEWGKYTKGKGQKEKV